MLLRNFTDFILRSRIHAMGVAFALSFVPLLGASISILIATLITLRKGAYEGTLVLGASLAPYLMNYVAVPDAAQSQTFMIAVSVIAAINVLTWLLALILRCYNSWNAVLEISVLAGVVLVGVIHVVFPDIQGWWQAQINAYLDKTVDMITQLAPDGGKTSEEIKAAVIANKVQHMTGYISASIIFNALFQLVVARWWQAAMFNPGGLRKELYQIRLSYVSAVIFTVVLVLAGLNNTVAMDIMPVIAVGFCFAGLSLIHCVLPMKGARTFWLSMIYLGIAFIYPSGIMIVAVVGLLDSLCNIRLRMNR